MQNSRTRDLPCSVAIRAGAVAQLGERLVRNEEVRGSTPLGSTTTKPRQNALRLRFRHSAAGRVFGNSYFNSSSSAQLSPCAVLLFHARAACRAPRSAYANQQSAG